ncbi:hypothetical protein [Salisaeta longa]|uniref:hypothetical protein n=1 Tax=Salisaeta longa TaxID=503170 RepID=UPI0003B3E9C3|nr:hypothetical protein [Salisaeta longa]
MQRFRTYWGRLVPVVVLVASLLPLSSVQTLVAPPTSNAAYAQWLHARLPATAEAVQPDVQAALEAAQQQPAPSLAAFVEAFVQAYAAQQPSRSLAQVIGHAATDGPALVRYLRGQQSLQALPAVPGPRLAQWLVATSTAASGPAAALGAATRTLAMRMHMVVQRWGPPVGAAIAEALIPRVLQPRAP